jgi:prolyl oligopeptidase
MGHLMNPPFSPIEPVTDVFHGIVVNDPYRWLEDQDDPRTREWLDAQTRYAHAYLDVIPGRDRLRKRVQEFLDVETYDCLQKRGERYFFRKRSAAQQQPSIYMREGSDGEDQLLIDPSKRGTGIHTAVKPLHVSPNGQLLLYEVKQGGERTGTFEVLDVESRQTLPDVLDRGYLRAFAFAPDGQSFYYVHEPTQAGRLPPNAAYHHALGAPFHQDREVFRVGGSENLRISLVSDGERLGFLVYRFLETLNTDFYVKGLQPGSALETIVRNADYVFGPVLVAGRVFAITDRGAPNLRIVEVRPHPGTEPEWMEVIPETNTRIHEWRIIGERIFVSYVRQRITRISIFDFSGREAARMPVSVDETLRLNGCSPDELFIESESFTKPITLYRFSPETGKRVLWATRKIPFDPANFKDTQVGTRPRTAHGSLCFS